MSTQAILLPLFVEVILTFLLWVTMATLRTRDFSTGAVRPEQIALREPNWPTRTLQFAYSFSNQFEIPVLFYVLTILAYITHLAGLIFVILAWIFVIFRILHAYVHVTSNVVRVRGALYGVAVVALAVNWAIYIFEVLTLPRPI
ncbi:MAG TPA: MAPEG family protein [Xanthobacteraceae bacterium]|nr:MAPEG family protein [Xanthobacteraceae bacterium]